MTHVSTRIRAIALDPTPANVAELPKLALMVRRMEVALDEICRDAQEDAALIVSDANVVSIRAGMDRMRRTAL